MHELITSPFLDDYLVLRPGSIRGLKIPDHRYLELGQAAATGGACPAWLVCAAGGAWADVDLTGRPVAGTVLLRPPSPYGFSRASYELNLGCNYDCEHCCTEAGYDSLTRRRGSYRQFMKGLDAACEAALPINLNLIVTTHNAHEHDGMVRIAEDRGLPHHTFSNMSPTIYGGADSLPAQSFEHLRKRKPFTGRSGWSRPSSRGTRR